MRNLKQPKLGKSMRVELEEVKAELKEWHDLCDRFIPANTWPSHGDDCGCLTCELRKIHSRQSIPKQKSRLAKREILKCSAGCKCPDCGTSLTSDVGD
jgi:hypothetical protein